MNLLQLVLADLSFAWRQTAPSSLLGKVRFVGVRIITVRGCATVGFRLSHAVGRRSPILGSMLKQVNQFVTGADIDYRAIVGPGLYLPHPGAVVVAPGVVLGEQCTIHSSVTIGSTPDGAPEIGDGCNLAPGCRIIGPVRLAARVRVYPNAVVTRSFDETDVVLAGLPARIVRKRDDGSVRD